MSLWVDRPTENGGIVVHATAENITVAVAENTEHLRHFWGQLGRLLEEMDNE